MVNVSRGSVVDVGSDGAVGWVVVVEGVMFTAGGGVVESDVGSFDSAGAHATTSSARAVATIRNRNTQPTLGDRCGSA